MSSIIASVRDRLRDDAAEWRLAGWQVAAIALAPVVVALSGIVAFPFRGIYAVLANEDGVVEWLQFGILLVLIGTYAILARRLWRADRRGLAVFYALCSLAALFIAGEEISWGQRILGFATPDGLDALNAQGETNLHNIGLVTKVFNLVVVGLCALAILFPILRWTGWRATARTMAGYVVVPPLALIPAFALPFAHRMIRLGLFPEVGERISKYAEFAELSFYFGLLVFAWLAIRAVRGRWDAPDASTSEPSAGDPAAITVDRSR